MGNLRFKRMRYASVAAGLFLFAVCSHSLYAANESGSGEISVAANDSPQSVQESKVGTAAPKFTLTSIDGKSISLAELSNQYVVLNFWASSSQESRKINADIAKLEKQYKNADIVFVSISLDENKANWQAAVQQDGLTGLQVSELKNLENADITKLYGVSAIPAVYIINPDGVIISIDNGNVDLFKKLKDIFGV